MRTLLRSLADFHVSQKLFKNFKLSAALLALSLPLLQACSVNPATGQKEFTPFISQESEKSIGQQEHSKIVAEYGGVYPDKKLTEYVLKVTDRITGVTEIAKENYKVTVLNTPTVNAFALPGGYIYVTRGLLALANSEAQLAGVIGHESGHVTARHSANQANHQAIGGIGAMLLGALTGSQAVAQLAQVGAQGYVASYSRKHEYEADSLGVRYLTRAEYSPFAQSQFLDTLDANTKLDAKVDGQQERAPGWTDSHPPAPDRVQKAAALAEEAQKQNPKADYDGVSQHFNAIDGMIYGDNPDEGVIDGQTFLHPKLKFTFTVTDGYQLINTPAAVIGVNESSGGQIKFDGAKVATGETPGRYLQGKFLKGSRLNGFKEFNLNGMSAATAWTVVNTQKGAIPARVVIVEFGKNYFARFVMTAPENAFKFENKKFEKTALSFRKLSAGEIEPVKPYRIRMHTVKAGETAQSLSAKSPLKKYAHERFMVLNGLKSDRDLKPGMRVKLVGY